MIYLPEEHSAKLVTRELAFHAASRALMALAAGASRSFPVVHGHSANPQERFSIKSGSTENSVGLKVGAYWPGNLTKGLPRHSSTIMLLEPATGRLKAVVEAALANAYRTAAADAVAVQALARPEATTVAVFGVGHQAEHEVLAVAASRRVDKVLVVGRDPTKAEAFAGRLRSHELVAMPVDAKAACSAAEIILTATNARAPLFDAAWIRPGTHISSMGSDAAGKQELPPELFASARLFCDLAAQSRVIGEFQHAPRDLELTEVGSVVAGYAPGRRSDADITIFDSSGTSIQDLALAEALIAALQAEASA